MTSGPLLFARFAYPPNALGYCGPDAAGELLEYADAGAGAGGGVVDRAVDGGLRRLARGFAGAWPYLELIAAANGRRDPLDAYVVEAYWVGNRLLDAVDAVALGASLEARFRGPAGPGWPRLADVVEHGARPHHNLHVFCVYPWVGLLRTGATDHALQVLDRCRVRWGRVRATGTGEVGGGTVVVESSPLRWDGRRLLLGPLQPEVVTVATAGRSLAGRLRPGDLVACHWDWVCHRLTPRQAVRLRAETATQLDLVNSRLAFPPPAAVLS